MKLFLIFHTYNFYTGWPVISGENFSSPEKCVRE